MVLPGTRSYGDILPGTAVSVALPRRSFFPLKPALYACAQLATLFWLTAASNGVYKFVVQKNTKTTVEIELTAEELEEEIQRQKQRQQQNLPVEAPHLTKSVSVMNFFYTACFGIPLLLVVGGGGWDIALPDLRSRMGAALQLEIGPPDDALATDLMLSHAAQRGLVLGEGAPAYLVPRMERSYAAIEKIVGEIDRLSLERQVPATLSVWRDALEAVQGPDQGRLL